MGFIETMNTEKHFAVESICRALRLLGVKVAARTYRWWKQAHRPVAARTVTDAHVVDAIRDLVWTTDHLGRRVMAPEGLYGRRKMFALVRSKHLPQATPGAVDRAMRLLELRGVKRAKGPRPAAASGSGVRAQDLLERDFTASRPNEKWVTDFTYCRTWAGWVYVTFIIDCFSGRIVAWHAQTVRDVDLVLIPLKIALWACGRAGTLPRRGELIIHSDAGSQYTSVTFTKHVADKGLLPSIGSNGDAYDNALAESVNALFKTECIRSNVFHAGPFKTAADIEYATSGWVDWYNNRRLHSSLDYISPVEYEAAHYATLNRELAHV